MRKVKIYTDGGCSPNPGPGGWAAIAILENGEVLKRSGAQADTTNNRMELTAAIEALLLCSTPCEIELYSDSQYVVNGIERWIHTWIMNDWKTAGGDPVKNGDLWRQLNDARSYHKVTWKWVKGHNGNMYNEQVDAMVRIARKSIRNS